MTPLPAPPKALLDAVRLDLSDVLWGRADYVIWSPRGRSSRYVQACRSFGCLVGEVVGPRNLTEPLSLRQYEILFALGWDLVVEPHGNHQRIWMPWSVGVAAEGLSHVLALVFGVSGPQDMVVERADNDDGPPWLRSLAS